MKWEYQVSVLGDLGNASSVLNGYGDQGWELVQVVVLEMPVHSGGRDVALVFKRPKKSERETELIPGRFEDGV